jgi:ribosomal 30S subunit maturation factor RimM
MLVKFEDFNDPQSASILVGRDLFAPPGLLADGSDESWDPEEFIGMMVRDEEHGDLGEVTGHRRQCEEPGAGDPARSGGGDGARWPRR